MVTFPKIPDEVHSALRVAAAQSQAMEAEVGATLGTSDSLDGCVKLGSLLAEIGRQAELTDDELAGFERIRGR